VTPAEAESLGRRWLAAEGGWSAGMLDGYDDDDTDTNEEDEE